MADLKEEILKESITLPEQYQKSVLTFVHYLKFKELAKEHNIDPDRLLELCIEEISKQTKKDFQKALDYVLNRYKELYERLA